MPERGTHAIRAAIQRSHATSAALSRPADQIPDSSVFLKRQRAACASAITYHRFGYPNALTMEGLSEGAGASLFFRPDGHPRPSLGQLVVTRILALEDEPSAPPVASDFGADLLAMSTSEGRAWTQEREARCHGNWTPGTYRATLDEMRALTPAWRSLY